jgi:hypothetical protein
MQGDAPGETAIPMRPTPQFAHLTALAFLAEKRIAVASLPPHLTHLRHPMDVCLERLTGPGGAGRGRAEQSRAEPSGAEPSGAGRGGEVVPLGPDAQAEDDARAETDLPAPAGIPSQTRLPRMSD